MKKTIFTLMTLLCTVLSTFANNILHIAKSPQAPAGNITYTVFTGDTYYDSGGPGKITACIPPVNMPELDEDLFCTSIINICGNGKVKITFNTFSLANGVEYLGVYNGKNATGTKLGEGKFGASLAGSSFTSTSADGCLSFKYQGISLQVSDGWDGSITVIPSTVQRAPAGSCALTCNDQVNASMPATPGVCTRRFEYNDFLENPDVTCNYTIQLVYPFGTNKLNGDNVDRSHLGYNMVYKVMAPNGNSCWGYVKIEDKAAPQAECKSRSITCFQLGQINALIGQIVDNCGQPGKSKIEKMKVVMLGDGCDSTAGIARVERTIRTWDIWNNSTSCSDTLTITRDSLQDVKCAELVEFNCEVVFKKDGSESDRKKDRKIIFSKDINNANYPTPDLLLALRKDYECSTPQWTVAGQYPNSTPEAIRVVPQIADSVYYISRDPNNQLICIPADTCIDLWPIVGGVCKTTVGWSDEILDICAGGFKIRRQWRIANWCTNTDTVCIQYIKVEDKQAPVIPQAWFDDRKYRLRATVSPHECLATVTIPLIPNSDCSPVAQNYTIKYGDPAHPGKIVVLAGTLPATVKLPAFGAIYGYEDGDEFYEFPAGYYDGASYSTHQVNVNLTDACLNVTNEDYFIETEDITPPTPICDEFTQTSVDPAACWSRIYAKDLDNGSRDNCCDVLHFAVAHMDTITAYRNKWINYWTATCKTDYWDKKAIYDNALDELVNCYVFKDYIDVTECGTNQVVMRVYEACGVPRYDPHVFPCSEHDWFTYNSYGACRLWHNYTFFNEKGAGYQKEGDELKAACTVQLPLMCRDAFLTWLHIADSTTLSPIYEHSGSLDDGYYIGSDEDLDYYAFGEDGGDYDYGVGSKGFPSCFFEFGNEIQFLNSQPTSSGNTTSKNKIARNRGSASAPGNHCSNRKYNDCMVQIIVDDKTPPVAETPGDIFWYCDDVARTEKNQLEYAAIACNDYVDDEVDNAYADDYLTVLLGGPARSGHKDNAADYTCVDKDGLPYGQIECDIENGDTVDTKDATGKFFGWYGCNVYGPAHQDEHGTEISPCPVFTPGVMIINPKEEAQNTSGLFNDGVWVPIYCHTWLCLDRNDKAGKVDPKTAFKKPVLRSVGKGASAASGEFIIWDNCWIDPASLTTKDDQFIDKCGNGWIQRTWTAADKCKNTVSVSQKIVTKHRSDFEVTFPLDTVISCAADEALNPDVTGRPMIMDDECELVGVNYTDERFDVVTDACYKIVRTWKIINWCKYDPNQHDRYPDVIVDDRLVASLDRYCVYRNIKDDGDGYVTYTQIIKVVDNEAPSITCANDTLCINTGYSGAGAETDPMCTVPTYTSKDFAGTDNCTPAAQLSFRWELDVNNNGSVDTKSAPGQKRFSSNSLTVGTHKLIVIAEDNCGNEDTTSCLITVKDCKKPTPYCYNGIATVIMPSTGSVIVWASDLNAGSYDNCTKKADLKFSFDAAGLLASDTFRCADIPNGISATNEVNIYVWDATGNVDFCKTYLLIQDGSGNICPDQANIAGSIAGKVATESTEPVESVVLEVKSTSNALPAFKTTASGIYAFNGLDIQKDYSITPSRNDDPINGVSTVDLVLIQKHILGVQELNTAYKVIAADADRSNDVSAIDLVELRKLILTVYDKLPNNASWRFVPKSYNFSNINNPWGFPEKLDITGLSKDEINRDFVGIKVGDVNGTVVPHSLLGAEARELGAALKFRTADKTLSAGEETTIEFTADNFSGIEGYQFSMAVKGLEIKSVIPGVLRINNSNFGMTKLGQGYLTTSWNESRGITAKSNEVLFSLKVKATKALTLSESLVVNSKYTRAEAYNGANNLAVALEVGKNVNGAYALHQNTPNPFKATTLISYELPKSEKVTLKISDVTGRVIRVYTEVGNKGLNQFKLHRNEISGAGVLYYSMETKDFSATKKMIVVE